MSRYVEYLAGTATRYEKVEYARQSIDLDGIQALIIFKYENSWTDNVYFCREWDEEEYQTKHWRDDRPIGKLKHQSRVCEIVLSGAVNEHVPYWGLGPTDEWAGAFPGLDDETIVSLMKIAIKVSVLRGEEEKVLDLFERLKRYAPPELAVLATIL